VKDRGRGRMKMKIASNGSGRHFKIEKIKERPGVNYINILQATFLTVYIYYMLLSGCGF